MVSLWLQLRFLQIICILFFSAEVHPECTFPPYLQSPLNEHNEYLPWQTKVWWLNLRKEPKQREMQEIFVMREHIWSHRQNNRWPCDNPSRISKRLRHRATYFGNCSEKYLEYNRTCVLEERPNRYKVVQYGPGLTPSFLCLKFEKRTDNVIQVMEGPVQPNNSADLCDDDKMVLMEWPWIAPWKKEIETCPITGGFTFRTVSKLTNEDFCEDEWRKSRLEIDCAKGDGLNFIAPKGSSCNPFSSSSEASRFYCWAGWQHKHYTFLVIGEESGVPKYCLRFPLDPQNDFSVIVYFSVVCPTDPDGKPERGIEYHEMKMTKRNPDLCTDDDIFKCQQVHRREKCDMEKYAHHCERSCGKCAERHDLMGMMCAFSASAAGTWLFMDIFREERVIINKTTAIFTKFGTFTCKEKSLSPKLQFYKTVTTYTNGCAMRYTCLEFHRQNQNILQFRAGSSFTADVGFEQMCQFDAPSNQAEHAYRGRHMKNLILDGNHWGQFCGFGHTIPFNGTIYGESCYGEISDWDADACVAKDTLYVKSNQCDQFDMPMEFKCLGFLKQKDNHLEQFLITKSKKTGEYNCWVITAPLCKNWDWKYRAMYRLQSPQCSTLSDSPCIIDNSPRAFLYLHDEDKSKFCKPEQNISPGQFLTTSSRTVPERGGITYSPYWTDPLTELESRSGAGSARKYKCIDNVAVLASLLPLVMFMGWLPT